ncbi:MAG: potassium channel family protein [Pyrinomonadaceae bacterium]
MGGGTIGFHLIEGWSILDSLYASAQTVTTVGYGDVTPVTRNGRFFCDSSHAWRRGRCALCVNFNRTCNRSIRISCHLRRAAAIAKNEQTQRSFHHLRRGTRRFAPCAHAAERQRHLCGHRKGQSKS